MFSAFLITRSAQTEHWRPSIYAQQRNAGLVIFISAFIFVSFTVKKEDLCLNFVSSCSAAWNCSPFTDDFYICPKGIPFPTSWTFEPLS